MTDGIALANLSSEGFTRHVPFRIDTRSAPASNALLSLARAPGGKLWLGGAFKVIPSEKQWGRLAAVNVDTGKVAWKVDTEQPLIDDAKKLAFQIGANADDVSMILVLSRKTWTKCTDLCG